MSARETVPDNGSSFAIGDKVRVASSWLAKTGDVYTVEAVSDTHIRASNGSATLSYLREKWIHA